MVIGDLPAGWRFEIINSAKSAFNKKIFSIPFFHAENYFLFVVIFSWPVLR